MKFLPSALLPLVFAAALPAQEAAPPGNPAPASPPAPAAPGASTAGSTPDPAKAIKKLDDSRYELNGITFDKKTRAITIPSKVNMTEGNLEYALVHEAGKVHESLLSTAISPFDLNVVLLLLNYEPGSGFFDVSDKAAGAVAVKNPKLPPTSMVNFTVDWKGPDGAAKSARLESLMLNIDKKGTVTEGPFVYTGSMLTDEGAFMARETGSILAVYNDAAAVFNNPRPGDDDDDIWIPDKTKVPARDTPVTVTILPAPAAKTDPKTGGKPEPKPGSKAKSVPKRPVKK